MKVRIAIIADTGHLTLEQVKKMADRRLGVMLEQVKVERFGIRPHVTLEELVTQCDPAVEHEQTEEDRLWLNDPPVGKEII